MTALFSIHSDNLSDLLIDADYCAIKIDFDKIRVCYRFSNNSTIIYKQLTVIENYYKNNMVFDYNSKALKSFIGSYEGILYFYMDTINIIVEKNETGETYKFNRIEFNIDEINFNINNDFKFEIDSSLLISQLNIARDNLRSKYEFIDKFDNLYINLNNNKVSFKCTDGYIFSIQILEKDIQYSHSNGIMIDKKIIPVLIELLKSVIGNINICLDTFNKVKIYSDFHNIEISYRSEKYMDNKSHTDIFNAVTYSFDSKLLKKTINNIVSNNNNKKQVFRTLLFENDTCTILLDDQVVEKILCKNNHSHTTEIYVNLASISKSLKNVKTANITLYTDREGKASYYKLLSSTKDITGIYLQMLVVKPVE